MNSTPENYRSDDTSGRDRQQRVLFMGTPDFAVPALTELANAGYSLLVVTQPDKPVGRKKELTAPPVKEAAIGLGLSVLQPEKVRTEEALQQIREFAPDVLITAAYGQLLPQRLLDIPRVGSLNVHASLLPRWRGAAPIQRAIMAGDTTSGVALMEMVLQLDAGPVVKMQDVPIEAEETFGSLHDKLAAVGAKLLMDTLPLYLDGKTKSVAQPEEGVTYANRIIREDEFVDFTKSALEISRQIRGLSPWPGASTFINQQPFKIWSVSSEDKPLSQGRPGEVSFTSTGQVQVMCGVGSLLLKEVQPAGKRRMDAADWLRGQQAISVQLG